MGRDRGGLYYLLILFFSHLIIQSNESVINKDITTIIKNLELKNK